MGIVVERAHSKDIWKDLQSRQTFESRVIMEWEVGARVEWLAGPNFRISVFPHPTLGLAYFETFLLPRSIIYGFLLLWPLSWPQPVSLHIRFKEIRRRKKRRTDFKRFFPECRITKKTKIFFCFPLSGKSDQVSIFLKGACQFLG